jgi:hypothetical protein
VAPPDGCAPHHNTQGRARGKKASDFETMPLCLQCHRDLHDHRGRFGFGREALREWQAQAVARTQKALGYSG